MGRPGDFRAGSCLFATLLPKTPDRQLMRKAQIFIHFDVSMVTPGKTLAPVSIFCGISLESHGQDFLALGHDSELKRTSNGHWCGMFKYGGGVSYQCLLLCRASPSCRVHFFTLPEGRRGQMPSFREDRSRNVAKLSVYRWASSLSSGPIDHSKYCIW